MPGARRAVRKEQRDDCCGGFFKQGQVLSLANAVPNNQLLTTVCHAMGLQVATVGPNYAGDLDSQLKA